jgi:hypothetical protein
VYLLLGNTRVQKPKATGNISFNFGISSTINHYKQLSSGIVSQLLFKKEASSCGSAN